MDYNSTLHRGITQKKSKLVLKGRAQKAKRIMVGKPSIKAREETFSQRTSQRKFMTRSYASRTLTQHSSLTLVEMDCFLATA